MRKLEYKLLYLSLLGSFSLFSTSVVLAGNDIIVVSDTKHDTSLPLRDVPSFSLGYKKPGLAQIIENTLKSKQALIHLEAFQGIGVGLGSYVVSAATPDLTASAGLTQLVQWVNPDLAVFDKATGVVAAGFPKPGNAIWFGFGGPCETQNAGLPIVKFDQLANRWVLTRQAYDDINAGPFYQCVAISTTEDATGSYYRYAFPMDSLNNYGKIGLWPDAYYLAMTMFGPVSNGPRACALDRDKMLLGLPATIECKQLSFDQSQPLNVADLSGHTLPAPGSPAYFFSLAPPNNLLAFNFHADFVNPANATFSSGILIPVNNFAKACPESHGNDCVVQPNTTNKLDVLGDRFPTRISYRQFPRFGSFVATHNIQGPSPKLSAALRWYELRLFTEPNAIPTVYQQATLAPDSKARFKGSILIDRFQNIAIGYTVSSSRVHPSLELGYRHYYDPLNNLTIQPMVTGLGSQTSGSPWTSNSSLIIDPADNCTFWYSSEYLKTDGSFNWSTAFVKFKLAACT